jgi:hypothetical protein
MLWRKQTHYSANSPKSHQKYALLAIIYAEIDVRAGKQGQKLIYSAFFTVGWAEVAQVVVGLRRPNFTPNTHCISRKFLSATEVPPATRSA